MNLLPAIDYRPQNNTTDNRMDFENSGNIPPCSVKIIFLPSIKPIKEDISVIIKLVRYIHQYVKQGRVKKIRRTKFQLTEATYFFA